MSNEPFLNIPPSQQPDPNALVENASLAVEARIAKIIGGGSFGFWIVFLTICLSALALLAIALFMS
jgi:hypothetical protein